MPKAVKMLPISLGILFKCLANQMEIFQQQRFARKLTDIDTSNLGRYHTHQDLQHLDTNEHLTLATLG